MGGNGQIAATATNGEGVRERILLAAEAVFAERGFRGASTREIASRAGIGKRMLFYYFPNKDVVYRAVLERIVGGLVAVHQQVRGHPGPIGLAEAMEGITHFVAANLQGFKVWMREIMDGGPHLAELTERHLAPLFAGSAAEVRQNMERGIFRAGEPMHVLLNVGGLTLFYFLNLPLLELLLDRDPLEPAAVAERAAAARDCLMYGLAGPAVRGGTPP